MLCMLRPSPAGSHVHQHFDIPSTPVALECAAGDAVVFDYRIKHRGIANRSLESRPVLYLTYGKVSRIAA